MARRISVQNTKMSNDLQSATSHFADSSGSKAARLVAKGFSGSIVPGGFKNKTSKKSGVVKSPTKAAWATMENAAGNLTTWPARRLWAHIITTPTNSAQRTGHTAPATG